MATVGGRMRRHESLAPLHVLHAFRDSLYRCFDRRAEAGVPPKEIGFATKGERVYHWARVALPGAQPPGMGRWLLVRRSIADPDKQAY